MCMLINIHGDNIVECERALELIKQALGKDVKSISGPQFSATCPRFIIKLNDKKTIVLTFYPGFGRWKQNILDSIKQRGGRLREAADVIVTRISDRTEIPLCAIEFCGALPAGNQAWQRSGRAFSFGAAKVPYLYISELGGYELNNKRERKASRLPNPAVPFSYLSYSLEKQTPVFPIFITAPGADSESRKIFKDEFADGELVALVRAILLDSEQEDTLKNLRLKVLSFVKKKGDASRKGETLSGEKWQKAYDSLFTPDGLPGFLINEIRQPWSKTAYIKDLTDNAKYLMQLGKKYGIGLTSTKLPMCLIDPGSRHKFANKIFLLYKNLSDDFKKWMAQERPLAICWVMGFKPKGDDARPDRGLPPMTRMLIGSNCDLMTVVYGPAPQSTWRTLENEPHQLAERNGLWEAIFEVSDALLVESATDHVSRKGYVRAHWEKKADLEEYSDFHVPPQPTRIGENDVDTVIHLLLGRLSTNDVFEGMCNPPGGDWSGVSILDKARMTELRWISLPRVSGPKTKRPDHVFQIFNISDKPIILSIESKETAQSLEVNIGPKLNSYLKYLMRSPASIERSVDQDEWKHSDHLVDIDQFIFASASAFLNGRAEVISKSIKESNTDLTFVADFQENGRHCHIEIWANSQIGTLIAEFLSNQEMGDSNISISLR